MCGLFQHSSTVIPTGLQSYFDYFENGLSSLSNSLKKGKPLWIQPLKKTRQFETPSYPKKWFTLSQFSESTNKMMPSCSPIVQTLHLSLSSSTHALFQSIPSLFPLQAPWLHDIIFRALTENSPGGTLCISAQVSFKTNLQTIHKNKCVAVSESVWVGSCSLTEGEGKWLKVDASRAHLYSWKQEDFADVFF